jgi:hypothetical protein
MSVLMQRREILSLGLYARAGALQAVLAQSQHCQLRVRLDIFDD